MPSTSLQQCFYIIHDSSPLDSPRRRACGQFELSLRVLNQSESNPKSAINALAERLVFARDDSDEMMEVIEQIGYLACAAGNRECFRYSKAIPMLAQKLGNKRIAFLRIALWCLGNLIVENPACAADLAPKDHLKRLVELCGSNDAIVCENATRVVASLTSYFTPQADLIEVGVLPTLMHLLDPKKAAEGPDTNRSAAIYAAMAMANLASKPEPRAELWRIVPRVLMGVLRCECQYTRCYAAAALANLACRDGFYQEQIREEGGIALLLGMLQSDTAATTSVQECTQIHVSTAMANLCHNNELNQREVARCDGLRHIVTLLRSPLQAITQSAIRAVGNIVSHALALQDALRASGVVPLLLALVRSPDDGIKICALQTLSHICVGNDDVKVALQRMGVIEHLDALLLSQMPMVRELATICLGDVAEGIVDIKALTLRQSGSKLCQLLEQWHAPEVQQAAMRTVAMLCFSDESQMELQAFGVLPRVMDIMQYSPMPGILEDSAKVVQAMLRSNQEMKLEALQCGVIKASISALYNGSDACAGKILKALWHLLQLEKAKARAKHDGLIPALLHVKQSYSQQVRKLAETVYMLFMEQHNYM